MDVLPSVLLELAESRQLASALRAERDALAERLAAAEALLETYRLDKEQENERLAAQVKARLSAEQVVENLVHASMDNTRMKLDLAERLAAAEALLRDIRVAQAFEDWGYEKMVVSGDVWRDWQTRIAKLLAEAG